MAWRLAFWLGVWLLGLAFRLGSSGKSLFGVWLFGLAVDLPLGLLALLLFRLDLAWRLAWLGFRFDSLASLFGLMASHFVFMVGRSGTK